MPSSRPEERLRDIVKHVEMITEYIEGLSLEEFTADGKTKHAVERCLLIISEAAVKLGGDVEEIIPEQPWKEIRGIGNIIRHDYDGVNVEIIWVVAKDELPALRLACLSVLERNG